MKKKPKFIRQGGKNIKRLGEKWRKPKGLQSKLRQHVRSRGNIPNVGYGSPLEFRGLHPSGLMEVLIHNVKDLENLNLKKEAARISSSVGRKKRIEIMKIAKEKQIKVLNPFKFEEEKKNVHDDKRK